MTVSRSVTVACLLAAMACGGPQRAREEVAAERPATPEEAAEIRDVVVVGQRGGFIRHDLAAYMAQWTDDARIVAARGEMAGQYDYALDRAQIEATRRLRFRGASAVMTIDYEDERITVAGDRATMRVRTRLVYREGDERVGEIFRLRRTATGWRVYENRYWPLSQGSGDGATVLDDAYYAVADARVAAERAADDRYELAVALLHANRHPEAFATLRELTDAEDAEAYDWVLRGLAAVSVGEAADAEAAFAAALALDPTVPVPDYAR